MSYVWENDSTQNAHIKHSNDNRQKAYMKKHRDDKAYERFKHIRRRDKTDDDIQEQWCSENIKH